MTMDALSLFGLFAVTAMLVAYALEDRSPWFILAFAGACALGSIYGFLQGAWPLAGRGDLGRRRVAALVCQAAITSPLPLRQDAKPCRALY
jgi:hypothetical protein